MEVRCKLAAIDDTHCPTKTEFGSKTLKFEINSKTLGALEGVFG